MDSRARACTKARVCARHGRWHHFKWNLLKAETHQRSPRSLFSIPIRLVSHWREEGSLKCCLPVGSALHVQLKCTLSHSVVGEGRCSRTHRVSISSSADVSWQKTICPASECPLFHWLHADWLIIHCYTIYHVKWKKWMQTCKHFITRRPDRRYSNVNTGMHFQFILHRRKEGSSFVTLEGGYCEATLMCYWGAVMSKTKATLTASIGIQSSYWEWAETSSSWY